MTGRGRLGELALRKGPSSIGRGLKTPGHFSKNTSGTQSSQRPQLGLKRSKPGSINPDSTCLSPETAKAHLTSKQPSLVSAGGRTPPENETKLQMVSNSLHSESDDKGGNDSTTAWKPPITGASESTIDPHGNIVTNDDPKKGQTASPSKKKNSMHQVFESLSFPNKDFFGNVSVMNGAHKDSLDEKQKQEATFRNDLTKVKDELHDLIQTKEIDIKSGDTVLADEKKGNVVDAEAEWRSFKLERQFNRILSNYGSGSALEDISKDFESIINERTLSSTYPHYNELRVALSVLLTKVKNTKYGANEVAHTIKRLADSFPNDFQEHFQSLIEETKASLITVVTSDTILSKEAKKFCSLLGQLYVKSYNEESRFHTAMCESVSTLVENWTYPDGIAVSLEGHQVNIAETHAGAVKILYEEIANEVELIRRSRKFAEEVGKVTLMIRESILNAMIPRTVREIYLDAALCMNTRAMSLSKEELQDMDNTVMSKAEPTGESCKRDWKDAVSEFEKGAHWDPYQNIKGMLQYLGFEEELNRFVNNLIRDTALSGDIDDTKDLLKEAKFPAGLSFEIISYLSNFGPMRVEKRPQRKKEPAEKSESCNIVDTYKSLPTATEVKVPLKDSIDGIKDNPFVLQTPIGTDETTLVLPDEKPDTAVITESHDISHRQKDVKEEISPSKEDSEIYVKGQTTGIVIPKSGFGRGAHLKQSFRPMSMTPPNSEGRCSEPPEEEENYDSFDNEDDYEAENSSAKYGSSSRGYGGGYAFEVGDEHLQSNDNNDDEDPQDESSDTVRSNVQMSDTKADPTQGNWRDHDESSWPRYHKIIHKPDYLGIARGFQNRNRGHQYSDSQYKKSQTGARWDKSDNRKNLGKTNRNQRGRKTNLSELANTRKHTSPFGSQGQRSCFNCGSKEHTTPECTSKATFFF